MENAKIIVHLTSFSGNLTYLPFRDIGDKAYKEWHNSLFNYFPNLVAKIHPKQKSKIILDKKYKQGDLVSICKRFDLLIFDYISTAFADISCLPKHILFIDIGIQSLSDEVKSVLKKRCHFVDNRNFDINLAQELKIENFLNKERELYARSFCVRKEDIDKKDFSEAGSILSSLDKYFE